MSDHSDSAKLSQTDSSVNSDGAITIGASTRGVDGCRRGTLRRGSVPVGRWAIWPGGPVTAAILGRDISSVQVDSVRGLLLRHGYAVAEAS